LIPTYSPTDGKETAAKDEFYSSWEKVSAAFPIFGGSKSKMM
jgi:hypothetical protein